MNKIVLITGTTCGIGYALAEIFAKNKFDIVLVSRNEEKLKKQKEYLSKNYSIKVHAFTKELSEVSAAEEIFKFTKNNNLQIDILINNAGFNESGTFYETDIVKEINMINVHVLTLTHLTKLFLYEMIKNKSGKILNLASTGAFAPCPLDAVYCATKAYVYNFSKAVNSELKGSGVSVSAVCPGATKTEFAGKADMENTMLFKNFVMPPEKVAETAYKKLMSNKAEIIPGLYNKVLVIFMRLTPYFILNKLSILLLKKRQHGCN
jgi:uncharacterized protein